MTTISLKYLFEKQIESIWNDEKYEDITIKKFGYAQQDNQVEDALLFIGINPSKSNNDTHKIFYTNGKEGTHKYFNKFIEISNQTNLEWSHIDLLFVRETKQDNVKKLLYSKDELVREFFNKQLEISRKMLETINSKIIVVNNTLARELLGFNGGWLDYKFRFDEELGTYRIDSKNSKFFDKPIFFTSMLTGQRALDNGSFKRLIWHINFVKNKIEN